MQVINCQYFGDFYLYKKISKFSHAEISLYQQYRKLDFLNRTVISGANGLIKLTIPVVGGRNQKTALADVRVSYDENWRKIHYRALVSSYNRSPWFEHYRDELAVFFEQDFEFLWEWIVDSMLRIVHALKLDLTIARTYFPPVTQLQELLPHLEVRSEVPKYPQVFEDRFGFLPGLSILDMLFCMGPVATLGMLTRP